LPGPRVMPIQCRLFETDHPDPEVRGQEAFQIACPPPAVLHVCSESRREALKKYTLKLSTVSHVGNVWIDPIDDYFYMPDTTFAASDSCRVYIAKWIEADSGGGLGEIRDIAMNFDMCSIIDAEHIANSFTSLEILKFISH